MTSIPSTAELLIPSDLLWLPDWSSVYTLRFHGFPVYVGQTANIGQRIHAHWQSRKLFDAVLAESVSDAAERDTLEGVRIHDMHPPLNRVCPLHCGHYGWHIGSTLLSRLPVVPYPCRARYLL